jgi:hypothetical protein
VSAVEKNDFEKNVFYWDLMPNGLIYGYQCFRVMCCLHFENRKVGLRPLRCHCIPQSPTPHIHRSEHIRSRKYCKVWLLARVEHLQIRNDAFPPSPHMLPSTLFINVLPLITPCYVICLGFQNFCL